MSEFVTAVIGASPNEARYSNMAVKKLSNHKFSVVPLGFRTGSISDLPIITTWPQNISGLRVVTIYIGPQRQPEFYDYIISLKPKTVVFNPGTENPEFYIKLEKAGIKVEEACTLVLLNLNIFKDL